MFDRILELLDLKDVVDQSKSEAIIALTTLLYESDGRVKKEEQELFQSLLNELPWDNSAVQSKEHFHREQVAKSISAISSGSVSDYIKAFAPALKSDGKVLALLRELATTDGELHESEIAVIKQVSSLMV